MKKLIAFCLVLFYCVIGHSQDVVSKNIGDFRELKVFDKIELELIESDDNRVEISGIKRREVNVIQNGDLLKIRMSLDNLWDNNNTKVTVYYTKINKIDANEGAQVRISGVVKANSIDVRAQEGAKIEGEVSTNYLFIKSVTGGEIMLQGEAREQEITINSGGQFFGKYLESKNTQVKISAGGVAEVNVKDYIKANTNAGGIIRIYGKPKEIDSQKVLGGKIIEVN